jgi:hypothetical protein
MCPRRRLRCHIALAACLRGTPPKPFPASIREAGRFPRQHVVTRLKQAACHGLGLRLPGFPRRLRRGLIESTRACSGGGRSGRVLHDEYVVASLKHRGDDHLARRIRVFHGDYVVASLKRRLRPSAGGTDDRIPRCLRRGLIEARCTSTSHLDSSRFSTTTTSWPH